MKRNLVRQEGLAILKKKKLKPHPNEYIYGDKNEEVETIICKTMKKGKERKGK